MKKILLGLILGIVLVSCGAISGVNSKLGKSQTMLNNTEWELSGEKVGSSRTPILKIEEGRISGNAGCNNYFSQVTLDEQSGAFSAKNIGVTRMACKEMQVEQNFLKMLEEANQYVSDGKTLELYKNQLLLMKFTRK
ncbi:META domain-containing protein [Riemerella columbina]|uniref:META domain-containing protein n=1 Tax=Riemerella columbina TaxID=103810 RepID=UPI00266F87AD|nr:META domain-containing protein [Riemerella columbina]WKS95988.1 META domain-containing protein [Riemerella columbina]